MVFQVHRWVQDHPHLEQELELGMLTCQRVVVPKLKDQWVSEPMMKQQDIDWIDAEDSLTEMEKRYMMQVEMGRSIAEEEWKDEEEVLKE